jgi:hypothetical protein
LNNTPLKGKVKLELTEQEINFLMMSLDMAGLGAGFYKQVSQRVFVLPEPLGSNNAHASDSFIGYIRGLGATLTQAIEKAKKDETGIISLKDYHSGVN